MEPIETIERAGYVASIHYDQGAESPAGWCIVGTLAYSTRRAGFGDMPSYWQDYGLETLIPADAVMCLPVYAYDGQMGSDISIADSWDRANGWIYATDACACGCGATHEMDATQLRAALESELESWNQWVQGDVYGVVVTSPTGEEVDSCWGFYGLEYAEEEAARMLDLDEVRLIESCPGIENIIIN